MTFTWTKRQKFCKIFTYNLTSSKSLEEQINEFLSSKGNNMIDIEFIEYQNNSVILIYSK